MLRTSSAAARWRSSPDPAPIPAVIREAIRAPRASDSVPRVTHGTILLDRTDGLVTLTLNRPQNANALNHEMAADLREAAVALSHDPAVRAVVVRSTGKVFCAGGDLAAFSGVEPASLPAYVDNVTIDLHAALARLAKLDAPVVAAVDGTCGGAGMSIVAALDLVVAGESAKFTMGYTRAGLVPDGTSTFFLARVVGLRRAMDLVLTNRMLTAAEAESWGLVNRVVPDGEVEAEASKLAGELAAGPTAAFGAAKRLLLSGASAELEAQMERESAAIAAAAETEDSHEGIAAFLAKRAPTFRGR